MIDRALVYISSKLVCILLYLVKGADKLSFLSYIFKIYYSSPIFDYWSLPIGLFSSE